MPRSFLPLPVIRERETSKPKMIPSLRHRNRQAEQMDAPDVDAHQLRRSLRFIRRINRLLGYTRATVWHQDRRGRRAMIPHPMGNTGTQSAHT